MERQIKEVLPLHIGYTLSLIHISGVEQVLTNGLSTMVSTITVVGPLLTIILMISLGWNYFKMLLELSLIHI